MKTSILFLAVVLLSAPAFSQHLPVGSDVLQKVERGVEGVNDYIVSLEADVDMERVQIPRAKATMYFKKPDKIHFESSSVAMIPRDGLTLSSAAVLEQYTAQTIGKDTAEGIDVIKLQLAAKEETARLRQLFVWVNPANWTIVRVETIPYEGRILTLDFAYGLQEGKYWLPVSLTAHFGFPGGEGRVPTMIDSLARTSPLDEMQSHAPRSGTIRIAYSGYKINVGLSDDVFKSSR
jgi:outer membrane lipoprotein-sorting protein